MKLPNAHLAIIDREKVVVRRVAMTADVVARSESACGEILVGDSLLSLHRTSARVRTVWIIERGSHVPHLVTAYPRRK